MTPSTMRALAVAIAGAVAFAYLKGQVGTAPCAGATSATVAHYYWDGTKLVDVNPPRKAPF